jgi:hypothetical protein
MIRVRAAIGAKVPESGQLFVQVALERDRDVRRAECRHDLESGRDELIDAKYDEHGESFE